MPLWVPVTVNKLAACASPYRRVPYSEGMPPWNATHSPVSCVERLDSPMQDLLGYMKGLW